MKSILLLSILVFSSSFVSGQAQCHCRTARKDDRTIWGHILDKYAENAVHKKMQGVIVDPRGHPLEGVLVEVFPAANKDSKEDYRVDRPGRLAACWTENDGKFCFSGIASGRYQLRCGRTSFNASFIDVTIGTNKKSATKKGLRVELQIGT